MAENVVGEVRVKVRPDATGFRRETDKDVDDAVKGIRAEVPIDGKLRVDRNKVQRELDQARAKLRGGDVKITAKIEMPISNAYKEWAAAADDVKSKMDTLMAQQKKWFGKNDARNDPLRMQLNDASKAAGELRQVYEELSKDTRRIQLADNKRLLDQEEVRTAALEAEKGRLAELGAAQLIAERNKQRLLGNSVLAESELERRRTANRFKSSFDYQRQQEKDNKAIELENRRHTLAMMDHTGGMSRAASAGNLQDYLMETPSDKFLDMNAKAVNDSFALMRSEADRTADHIDKLDPQLRVEPVGLMAMAAQMQWASRPRTVPFYVTIDQKSYAIAAGMLKSLAGLGVLGKLGSIGEDVLMNFDKFVMKAGTVAVAAAGLVSALSWVGTSSVAVAADLLSLSGGLLFVPAAFAAVAANMVIHTAAFKDFGDAVEGDNKALAKLPENAQKAALSVRGLWDEMAKPIRENFWEGMGDEFAKTVDQLAPKFTEGLADSAKHIGAAWGEVGRAMRELDDRGELKTMLDNMTTGFEKAVGAAHPLAEAINIIGLRGSEQLPRIGGWVTKIATGFRDWTKAADETGKLTEWLLSAEEAAGHVGTVIWDTGRAFKALADVSLEAGSKGLAGMADGMGRIADTMSSEPWQSNMVVLLTGARRGAAELNDGFLDLSGSIGDASVHFGRMLDLLGQLGGEVLTSVSIVVDNEGFQDGSTIAVEGMLKMTRDLAPAFDDLGTILGVFSRVAGAVFENVGGLIGDVVGLVKDLALTLEDNLVGLVPILGENLRLLVDILDGPLEATFGVLNKMLGVFNDLPGPIQTAVLALGALVAMRGSLGSLIGMVGTKGTSAFARLTSEVQKQPGMLAPLKTAWREQLAVVDKLNPATMRYATSVELMGRGRATLGHLATAYEHVNQTARNYERTASPVAASTKAMGDSFRKAGADLQNGYIPVLRNVQESTQRFRDSFGEGFINSMGFKDTRDDLALMGSDFNRHMGTIGEDSTRAHRSVGELATGFKQFTRDVGQDMRDLPGHVRGGVHMTTDSIKGMVTTAGSDLRMMGTHARAGAMMTTDALKGMVPDRVQAGFKSLGDTVSTQATRMGSSMAAAGGAISTAVAPIGTAAKTIGTGFQSAATTTGAAARGMATNLGTVTTAAAKAAASVGGAAGSSLKSAAGGLLGVLGGGWGVAIGGAIALIGVFAAKNAEAKQKVESLTGAMDAQTGALNADGIKQIAQGWTDLEDVGDPWANITRGAKAANETADILGISMASVTQAIVNGGPEYDDLIGNLGSIQTYWAMKDAGPRAYGGQMDEVTASAEKAAAALGVNLDNLSELERADLSNMIDNIEREEAALRLSEAAWKGVADAQGQTTGEAKKMAAAMQTIGDESITAAEKIGAIRTSLDLLSGGAASARDAEMAAAGMHAAALEGATALGERIALGEESLFDASGMLNSQSSIGRDLHQLLSDSADGLLIEAQAAYDAADLRGETSAQASQAAMDVMETGDARLAQLAAAAGVSVDTLKADWETFFGEDWMLEATFTATADKFLEAEQLAKDAGAAFSQEEFSAFLKADPDPATLTTAELSAWVEGQMTKQYQAALTAISPQAMSELAKVSTTAVNWSNADYVAHLKSLDKTHPGIYDAVTAIANMTGGDYKAAIQALNSTGTGISAAKLSLMGIPTELVDIIAQWAALPPPPVVSDIPVMLRAVYSNAQVAGALATLRGGAGGSADGSIWNGKSSPFAGQFGMAPVAMKAFANGGIENHVAQIARSTQTAPVRIWAEPETHGESYIPHSVYKRKRSLEIWKETGKILGVDMRAYEDGGIEGGSKAGRRGGSASGAVTVNIDQMVNHSDASPDEFARSLFRKVRAAGALTPLEVI